MDRTSLSDPVHASILALLPWYVSGQLDVGERATVTDHLAVCEDCRAELQAERAMGARVAAMPVDVDLGWAAMRQRIEGASGVRRRRMPAWLSAAITDRPRTSLLIAAQFLALLAGAILLLPAVTRPATYHVLGSSAGPAPGNALVMFAPGTPTSTAIGLIGGSEARIVDGPTATGALVLAVPVARRSAVLTRLRADRAITLAEPLDP